MSLLHFKKIYNTNLFENIHSNLITLIRNGHHLRGRPPGIAKSLEQKLQELNVSDPAVDYKVDIGLPPPQINKAKQNAEYLKILKAQMNNFELGRLSRSQKISLDLIEVNNEWLKTVGPYRIRQIAEHYGVFQHLFGDAYFNSFVPLHVLYEHGELEYPVYYGNILKSEYAIQKPAVIFNSDKDSLWTLLLTNPDGHFTDNNKEYVHWFVGNIPGNQIEKGETIVEYMQPFPPKGTGYHRHIFILYKQNKKLDLSSYKKDGPCLNLPERTFQTYEFYKSLQDDITPAALVFFQADWSPSVRNFYHKQLDMKEPSYEYDFPPPYIRPQEWFPLRKPFNLYMDKYRDPKQINKEFLVRKLKKAHPFKFPEPPLPYPLVQPIKHYIPSWLKLEIKKSKLKWGRINEIEE